MPAISEALSLVLERRRESLELAGRVLELADEGTALWVTARDAERWAAIKALVPEARVRLTGQWEWVCEMFQESVGDFVVHACGPAWVPSLADFRRLLDEREQG
jgi:hypothetical protein